MLWQRLRDEGFSEYAMAGIIGNLIAESALRSNNLQDCYNSRFGMSDEEYTAAVDNGTYQCFTTDAAGYGLAQWTFSSRKARLLAFAQNHGASIGDADMQAEFLITELREDYPALYWALIGTEDILTASNRILLEYERPADVSSGVQSYRAELGQQVYDRRAGAVCPAQEAADEAEVLPDGDCTIMLPHLCLGAQGDAVSAMQSLLSARGCSVGWMGADGQFGAATLGGLKAFQRVKDIKVSGICDSETWTRLLKG